MAAGDFDAGDRQHRLPESQSVELLWFSELADVPVQMFIRRRLEVRDPLPHGSPIGPGHAGQMRG